MKTEDKVIPITTLFSNLEHLLHIRVFPEKYTTDFAILEEEPKRLVNWYGTTIKGFPFYIAWLRESNLKEVIEAGQQVIYKLAYVEMYFVGTYIPVKYYCNSNEQAIELRDKIIKASLAPRMTNVKEL